MSRFRPVRRLKELKISMGPDAEPQLVFGPDQPVTVQLLDALPVSPLAPALEARL